MTNKIKQNPRLQPGASESPLQGTTHMNNATTPVVNPLSFGLTKKAQRKLKKLRPWNTWLTAVKPAPEYFHGAVKTPCCRFCGRVHFYIGLTCPDDPGIRALPCAPADRLPEWRLTPHPDTTILCGGDV